MPRVLVVDDTATTQVWVRQVLEAAGFEVTVTDNPLLVVMMVSRGRFDLVLLDVSMPLLDGDRVAAIMRNAKIGPSIVLHSSKTEEELTALVSRSGATGFIKKTSNKELFLSKVRAFLSESLPPSASKT